MPKPTPRREGFAGQHMIVLPEPLREHARQHELLRGFHVTDAGYFPAAAGHEVERANGAPTTLVILCLRGSGWVRIDDKTRTVEAGDLVWVPARQPHAYGASEEPWTIAWAHFSGGQVEGWRRFLRTCAAVDDLLLKLPVDYLDEIGLDRVYPLLERGLALRYQIAAATALQSSFCKIGEILVERHGHRSARERVAASVEALRRNWLRSYRLEELATCAGMSVTHYCAHFRELTGFAPIDFLIRLRIRHACHMLDTSQFTISQVATATGYNDPYYFTRCFRRVMGCSPQQYRKIPKG